MDLIAHIADMQATLDKMDAWAHMEGWPERAHAFIRGLYGQLNQQKGWALQEMGEHQYEILQKYLE